ncbi:MAG: hypothetical protein LBH43_20670 [Treponema sp.]|jgi:hypothetical protein|nr:hypothetical protein [Treponema sp.]
MAKDELISVLDFILNRCNEAEIEAVAAAVVRRRRDITLFGSMPLPDPARMAKELSSRLNLEGSIEGLKKEVREYAVRIIKQEAPELSDMQIEELCSAWIPEKPGAGKKKGRPSEQNSLPHDALIFMIDQFVSFSLGRMKAEEDNALRQAVGSWPEKYWKSFPQVARLLITDFLKGKIEEKEFNTRICLALSS